MTFPALSLFVLADAFLRGNSQGLADNIAEACLSVFYSRDGLISRELLPRLGVLMGDVAIAVGVALAVFAFAGLITIRVLKRIGIIISVAAAVTAYLLMIGL